MSVYIIKDTDGITIQAAIDEAKAIQICKDNKDKNWCYQRIPLYKSDYLELILMNNKSIKL